MTTFHRIELAAIVVKLALFCASAYGQPLQGEFAPQPPQVIAIPQPPMVYDPPPVLIQQPPRLVPVAPQGQWIRVRRPTGLGQFLFGDMYVFIPAPPPQQQQQMPPPQPQFDSRQRGIQ